MASFLAICLAVSGLVPIAAQSPRAPTGETEAEGWLRLLRQYTRYWGTRNPELLLPEWTDAAERHAAGEADEPAIQISTWPGEDLDFLLKRTLFELTATQTQRFEYHLRPQNRIVALVKRGAILHADIALLVPTDPWSQVSLRTSPHNYYIVQHQDGRTEGGYRSGVHLEVGRALFALLAHAGFRDAAYESLWYRATAASLVRSGQLGYAEPQLRVGLESLPEDARLLFYSGVLHEAFAAPPTQRVVEAAEVPPGYKSLVGSVRQERQNAEKLLARALRADPADAEVRLHHARVLGQLDRHAEAVVELASIDGKLNDPVLAYYAALFRGEEEAAIGHRDAARDAFERAAAIFPTAQSPLIALSHLARRYGDRAGAVAALRRLFALPSHGEERPDPWWEYYESHVRDADDLMASLRSRFAREATP